MADSADYFSTEHHLVDDDTMSITPITPVRSVAPEEPPKEKRRARLLRGIQRISSSPSLVSTGRARSSSVPYGSRASLSCVSLAVQSPGNFTPGTSTPGGLFSTAQTSLASSPITESPAFEAIETRLAIRKVRTGHITSASTTSIPLPPDIQVGNRSRSSTMRKTPYDFWSDMPNELRVYIFSFLQPKELVRASRASKDFHKFCFDGQLWTKFDATEFYQEIPAESLAKIIVTAGPFVKDLNLRGCVQVEHYKRAEVIVKACRNLINATLEGCRNIQKSTLHSLLKSNERLANVNLTGLSAVTNSTCSIIAKSCPQLESLNVSWCKHMDARGIKSIVQGCPKLTDLRAGEIKGFDNLEVAQAIFETNNLERLVLSGCSELNDDALRVIAHGKNPEIDILTELAIVPPRKLRHLDLSRCSSLTSVGVKTLGHLVPDLEGLQLSGCTALTDSALESILATTPRLTLLELEELNDLTNDILSEHLAKAPCAPHLEHLSVSYCENLGDAGMIPVMTACINLKSVDMDNTRIGDLVLSEAAAMVRTRAKRTTARNLRPHIGLTLTVYDCQMVTWTGIREVLCRNAEIRHPSRGGVVTPTFPTEIVGLKCYYGWQQTVVEHNKRVLRGDFAAAGRLERKWADYMQAVEEAGANGAGIRRRRRRAREAQMLHADEEEGGAGPGRRRARTMGSCSVM